MTDQEIEKAKNRAKSFYDRAGIVITEEEFQSLEITDLGLSRFEEIGLTLLVYVNSARVCAKEMVLFPHQICPEHKHPPVMAEPGKEETFRCRWGEVLLYVPGEPALHPRGHVPADKKDTFTVWHEIVLLPGEQYTIKPNTWHWFQAGAKGAVISEFSTTSRDESDIFTDSEIKRVEEKVF
ncbi:MAG: D-lyxose/D-mannose family sugar isomerase [Calditrichaeota bacterium]|nr:D-lyxose/D-mannose family sugar isomerase [Calditrichota bacterium]